MFISLSATFGKCCQSRILYSHLISGIVCWNLYVDIEIPSTHLQTVGLNILKGDFIDKVPILIKYQVAMPNLN